MPRAPRKTNQVSTWFKGVLREARRGDIFEDKTATTTLDTVKLLYPRLPSEDEFRVRTEHAGSQRKGKPPLSELQCCILDCS